MNWISNVVRPKIRGLLTKRDSPENLWVKCPETGEMVFHKDLEANQFVFPGSGYHQRIDANSRLRLIFDDGNWEPIKMPSAPVDPLKFRDERRYSERLKAAKAKTGLEDAIIAGMGAILGTKVVVAVQDFDFMGGSLGMAAGEAFLTAATRAADESRPFVLFAASGGARMQEGILSLMQLPRTTIAVEWLKEAGLPYIVVLTNPTTGGVTASYAMLGDIHIAEPGALIGFAGPRVIEQTIREKLPEGFQRAEYLREHGMVDMVVHRHELKTVVARICRLLTGQEALPVAEEEAPPANGENAATGAPKSPEDGANLTPGGNAAPAADAEAAKDASADAAGLDTDTSKAEGAEAADRPASQSPNGGSGGRRKKG